MNREQRRHPEKVSAPKPPPQKKELLDKSPPDDEQSARAKSHRHKKVTADKWNQ
jgi:hypothetical protein